MLAEPRSRSGAIAAPANPGDGADGRSGGLRLGATVPAPVGDNRPPRGYALQCLECGDAYEAMKPFGGFCCPAHRKDWNNRRMTRGAELYDLVMAWRYQRDVAKALGLWRLVCRLAAAFRDEDRRDRAGRRSWRDPRTVVGERPWLQATTLQRRRNPTPAAGAKGQTSGAAE